MLSRLIGFPARKVLSELLDGIHVPRILAVLFNPVKSDASGLSHSTANNAKVATPSDKRVPEEIVLAEAAALSSLFKACVKKQSQESFGAQFGIGSQGMVWQYLNGRRALNLKAAMGFAAGLQVDIGDFSPRLQQELIAIASGIRRRDAANAKEPVTLRVPVVGTARAGDEEGHYVEIDYPPGHGDGYVRYPTRDGNAYAVRIKGDSMRPRIQPGEYVVLEPNATISPGDEVLVRTVEGRSMVKKFGSRRSGIVELLSINEKHGPISIDVSSVEFMHHVGGIVKSALYEEE